MATSKTATTRVGELVKGRILTRVVWDEVLSDNVIPKLLQKMQQQMFYRILPRFGMQLRLQLRFD